MQGINGGKEIVSYLVNPAFLLHKPEQSGPGSIAWVETCCFQLADKMRLPSSKVEWKNSQRFHLPNQICKSPVCQWGNIDRAGNRIRIDPKATTEFDHNGLLFLIGHLLSHLESNGPEWIHDLRGLDLCADRAVPLIQRTAMIISMTPHYRVKALEFKSGFDVVQLGDHLLGEAWDDSGM